MEYLIIYLIFSAALAGFSKDFIQLINTNDNPIGVWFLSKRHLIQGGWWLSKVLSCPKCFSQYLAWLVFVLGALFAPDLVQYGSLATTALLGVSFGLITGLLAD